MKVILLRDMAKVGRRGEVKDVPTGYAINFLIPKQYAEEATPAKLARIQSLAKGALDRKNRESESLAAEIRSLSDKTVKIVAKANEKGHLYKAIHVSELIKEVQSQLGVMLSETMLNTDNIKNVGLHDIEVLGAGEKGMLKVEVVAE